MRKIVTRLSTAIFLLLVFAGPASSDQPDSGKIIIELQTGSPALETSFSGNKDKPRIGLTLSGGGARALAHIGVLKILEREGIDIAIISGVSMGGVVGGLYCAGYSPEEIEEIALSIKWKKLFSQSPVRAALPPTRKDRSEKSIIKIRFEKWRPVLPKGITSGQNLWQYLETLSARSGIRPSISFDYLNPPLRIVTTDLSTGERVVLSSGSLAEAMRASIAVPVAFTPVNIEGRLLVDGGLVDPIPVGIAKDLFSGPVIAVDVSSDLLPASMIDNVIDIADQTTTIMSMRKKKESLETADLVIRPDLHGRISTDFSDIHSIIEAGEEAAETKLPEIEALLQRNAHAPLDDAGYLIESWQIRGLSSMPVTFFKSVFVQTDRMTPDIVRSNLKRAFDSGYLSSCRAELTPSDSGYILVYYLFDNPRISRIELTGATLLQADEIKNLTSIKPGMVLNHNAINTDRKALENYYIRLGYSLIRVTARFRESDGALVFTIDEGKINRILVEGNRRTRDWAIRRHVPFAPGNIFSQEKANRGVEDLYGTDLFENARFIAVPDTAGVTLRAIVSEKPYKLIRSGARFDLEYGPAAFVDLADGNLLGAGLELCLSTTLGEKRRSVELNFEADRIWNTLYTYRLIVDYGEFKRNHYIDHEYKRAFREFHHGGELSLGRQIPRLGTIFALGQVRKYKWDEPEKAERQAFDKISISLQSLVDTRDAFDFPESGKYHVFNLEFAGEINDEKKAYTRFFTSVESYYRLSDRINFHPKISLGVSSNFMPYFDKFSLGGALNFSGLFEDEIVGEKLLTGEMEVRGRVIGATYLTARINFGNIWNRLESIRVSEMRRSGAIGLALKTPLGPVSLWYGRTGGGYDAFYLSVGYNW